MSPEQVRREIREYVRSGVDYLSYAVSDHHVCHDGFVAGRYIVFSPRVQQVIVEEARMAGMPVCGFRPATSEGVHLALEAGVDVVQAPFTGDQPFPEELVALLAHRKVPCTIIPTTTKAMEWSRKRANQDSLMKTIENAELNHQAFVDADVVLLLGTGGFLASADSDFSLWHSPESVARFGEGHFFGCRPCRRKG